MGNVYVKNLHALFGQEGLQPLQVATQVDYRDIPFAWLEHIVSITDHIDVIAEIEKRPSHLHGFPVPRVGVCNCIACLPKRNNNMGEQDDPFSCPVRSE